MMINKFLRLFCCLLVFSFTKIYGRAINDTLIVIFAENGKRQIKLMPRHLPDSCFRNKQFLRVSGYSYQVSLYDSNDKEKRPIFYDLYFTPVKSTSYSFVGWKKNKIKKVIRKTKRLVTAEKLPGCEKLFTENLSILTNRTSRSKLPTGHKLIKLADLDTKEKITTFINFTNAGITLMLAEQLAEGKYVMLQVNLIVMSPINSHQLRY